MVLTYKKLNIGISLYGLTLQKNYQDTNLSNNKKQTMAKKISKIEVNLDNTETKSPKKKVSKNKEETPLRTPDLGPDNIIPASNKIAPIKEEKLILEEADLVLPETSNEEVKPVKPKGKKEKKVAKEEKEKEIKKLDSKEKNKKKSKAKKKEKAKKKIKAKTKSKTKSKKKKKK